jgi:hypothetical protein
MRGGALPPALLCAALGLALAFAPREARAPSLLALMLTTTAVSFAPIPQGWLEAAFLACWVSVIAGAASVYLHDGVGPRAAVALSLNAGLWSGAVVALGGSRLDLAKALPWALVVLPAGWMVRRRTSIALKVVSSWLIAVAVLAAMLQFLPVTPGYLPDHLE